MLLVASLTHVIGADMDVGWIHPWVGLGWVGLDWVVLQACFVGWVSRNALYKCTILTYLLTYKETFFVKY